MAADSVTTAHRAVQDAEAKIANAERARDEAYDHLDVALAARGWRRMFGAFDGRLYDQLGGNPVPLAEVVAHETRVAAR